MKEQILIAMQKDIVMLKNVATKAIKQLEYQQGILGGVLESMKLMPGYQDALDKMASMAAEKQLQEEPKKTELD